MLEPSKKQRKLNFKPSQKRKTSTPSPSAPGNSSPELPRTPHSLAFGREVRQKVGQNNSDTQPPSKIPRPQSQLRPLPLRTLQAGPKKLVVKNLKPPKPHEDLEEHFEKIQKDVEIGTKQILTDMKSDVGLEILYKDIEELVRKDKGKEVLEMLEKNMKAYLDEMAEGPRNGARSRHAFVLPGVVAIWARWQQVTTLLRSVFAFLDHSYLLNCSPPTRLLDHCITAFRTSIADDTNIKERLFFELNGIINNDRKMSVELDAHSAELLSQAIHMFTTTNIYKSDWEPVFLASSKNYFENCANDETELEDYISSVTNLIGEEVERCDKHKFDSTTRISIQKLAKETMVVKKQDFLLQEEKLGEVMTRGDNECMKNLYKLLQSCGLQEKLKEPWTAFIKKRGNEICADKDNSEKLVSAVLQFKTLCDNSVAESFENDAVLIKGMKEAFTSFINSRHAKHPWGHGGSKVGELLAKYCDLLLRGGLNAIPENLLHPPTPDIVGDEAVEKYKTEEFNRQIDLVLQLFKHIDGKDAFQAYYKLHLARRLLNGRSLSLEIERSMITKLEKETGEDYVKDLVTMLKDLDYSVKETSKYNAEVWGARSKRLDLGVQMLSQSAWPKYPAENEIKLPHVVAKEVERFDSWYTRLHTGQKISWIHSLAQAEIRANLPGGKKYLVLGGLQAIVLVLFNDIDDSESLTYVQIQTATGMSSTELDRTLASLACGKQKILLKEPAMGGIATTDTFRINLSFTSEKNRVKIPQVALRDHGLAEVAEVTQVVVDRAFEIDGAIVRVLKNADGRKLLKRQLVGEVNREIVKKGRGAVEEGVVEKAAEKLVRKEYIDLDGEEYSYLP